MSFLNKNTLNCLCGQWRDGKNLLKTLILAFGVISKIVQKPICIIFSLLAYCVSSGYVCVTDRPIVTFTVSLYYHHPPTNIV